jgi:hypothetical protein
MINSLSTKVVQLFSKGTAVKTLPEDAALPDILTKMLVDNGCTVNKEGVEALAEYFVSTCLQIVQDGKSGLDKVRRDIEGERKKWP